MIDAFAEELAKKYDFTCDGMIGPDESDDAHLTILNRIVSLDKNTGVVSYEADPRHAKSVTTPAEKKKLADVISPAGLPQLDAEKTALYFADLWLCARSF